ncbi:nucleotidyltransferase domain-containing protein [Saccharibacillus sacchari]|uniref:Nucleotidyltransferase domain-containing protein n=1 Tax=Saccharibacillus sacchari TaxID=456493 RepID=A0ACC6PJE7_9BACL
MEKFNVFDVSSALIKRIRRDYAEDVAIAAYYGSYTDGTATERSDLDFFYIPANPQGYGAGLSFILGGRSFDFWPIDWERAERMARLEDSKTGILADCKLLYVRSDEDLERFNNLKLQIKDMRSFEGEKKFLDLAEKKLEGVYPFLWEMRRAGIGKSLSFYRLQAFEVVAPVLEAIALANRTYLRKGWGKNLTEIYNLPVRPAELEQVMNTMMRSGEPPAIIGACEHLVDSAKRVFDEQRSRLQPPTPQYVPRAEGFFEEFKGLLDKVQSACERKEYELAFFSAVHVESELNSFLVFCETGQWKVGQKAQEEGRKIAERAKLPSLVSVLDPANLFALQSAANRLEVTLERFFREQGVEIRKFGNLDEFRQFLLEYKPD